MGDLEVHRRLTARFTRLPTDHRRGELRQSVGGGEGVEVGLVEAVEREEDDRGALAGVAVGGQLVDVVGGQQRRGRQPPVRHVQREDRRPRRVVRRVAQDPAELGDLVAQRFGDRRLLRRRVEHLPALAAVVVYLDIECLRHVLGGALDDGPRFARSPAHRQPVVVGPAEQRVGPGRIAQCGGQLGVGPVRRPEVGRAGQQVRVRSADQARVTGHRGAQVGDEREHPDGDERQRAEMPGYHSSPAYVRAGPMRF